jgi:hypothetical protein
VVRRLLDGQSRLPIVAIHAARISRGAGGGSGIAADTMPHTRMKNGKNTFFNRELPEVTGFSEPDSQQFEEFRRHIRKSRVA